MKTHTIRLPLNDTLAAELLNMPVEAAGRALQAALAHYLSDAANGSPVAPQGAKSTIAEWLRIIDVSKARAAAGRAGGRKGARGHFAPGKNNFAPSKQAEALHEAVRIPDDFDPLAGLEAFM